MVQLSHDLQLAVLEDKQEERERKRKKRRLVLRSGFTVSGLKIRDRCHDASIAKF